jgi:hypothetical protein
MCHPRRCLLLLLLVLPRGCPARQSPLAAAQVQSRGVPSPPGRSAAPAAAAAGHSTSAEHSTPTHQCCCLRKIHLYRCAANHKCNITLPCQKRRGCTIDMRKVGWLSNFASHKDNSMHLHLGWCQQARTVAVPCCIVIMLSYLLVNVNPR